MLNDETAQPGDIVAPVADTLEAAPSDATAASPDTSEVDPLTKLLSDYDAGITPEPDGANVTGVKNAADPIDELLASIYGPSPEQAAANAKINDLQGFRDNVQQQMRAAQDVADAKELVGMIVKQVDDLGFLPNDELPDYVDAKLTQIAAQNPDVLKAFQARYYLKERDMTPAAGAARLGQIQQALSLDPNLAAKFGLTPERLNELRSEAGDIQAALNSPRALLNLERQFVKHMRDAAKKRVDPIATEDRNAVAAAVRGAFHGRVEEPAPDIANMGATEFQDYK